MKIFVDGREVRQTVVADAIEVLLECVEALKTAETKNIRQNRSQR